MEQFRRLPSLFLHFFDTHFLDLQAKGRPRDVVREVCHLATRLGYLSADVLYIPAASYFESDLCREIVDEFKPIFRESVLHLVGGGANIYDFVEEKKAQYSPKSPKHRVYFEPLPQDLPPYLPRKKSATKQIKGAWAEHLDVGVVPLLFEGSGAKAPRNIETKWSKVPDQLGPRAFIMEHVCPLLIPNMTNRTVHSRIQELIDASYFQSFTDEFSAGVIRELSYLETSYLVPSSGVDLSFRVAVAEARRAELLNTIDTTNALGLAALRNDGRWMAALASTLAWAPVPAAVAGAATVPATFHARNGILIPETFAMPPAAAAQPAPASGQGSEPTFGIITALPKEFAAVRVLLQDTREEFAEGPGAGRRYVTGSVQAANGGSHRVVLTMLSDMGNSSAAVRAALLLEHYPTVRSIIMTGIAGGVPNPGKPDDHVRLGDIVVSNRNGVVKYDCVKSERDPNDREWIENTARHPPRPPSAWILEAANHLAAGELEGSRPWLAIIDQGLTQLRVVRPSEVTDKLSRTDKPDQQAPHPADAARRPGQPRVFQGTIASADTLLKDSVKRDQLRDKYGVKAVEMEASGVAEATWLNGDGYFVVRGICDYCDNNKNDAWQIYAAVAAAGFTVALIQALPRQAVEQSPPQPIPTAEPPPPDLPPPVDPRGEKLRKLDESGDLRRLITIRMSREEIGVLWYDTFGELMEDQMASKGAPACVVELLSRAKRRNLLATVIKYICLERPDIAE